MAGRFDVILVDSGNIARGTNTPSGNPISKALRCHGYRGARIDNGGFLHLYDGKMWHLTILPKTAMRWLVRFLEGKPVQSFRFGLPKL